MKNRYLGRRQFLLLSFSASLSTSLMLSAQAQTTSNLRKQPNSLQFISVPPENGGMPAGVIVCLHGSGSRPQTLVSLARSLKLPDYHFLFPEAPYPDPSVPGGKMWYDLKSENNRGLAQSHQLLRDWLKSLEKITGIPLASTILSGFSQGGAMTLDVGLTLPLAGLVSLSGYLPSQPTVKVEDSMPPVLMVQGTQDHIVTIGEAQEARDSLTALGVTVKYVELDIGHELKPQVLAQMRAFVVGLFNQ